MDKANNPFDICFNIMKIRYADYDHSITNAAFVHPTDKVNVFINLESVFKNLSMIQDLERKLILNRNFTTILASNILNLAGHYKRFFVGNQLDTRVYLYHTDFRSQTFVQQTYNENYRSYFICKYTQNPKFMYLTDGLVDTVLPNVKTCCEFIPHVYYISAKDMEGSLVPYIIAKHDQEIGQSRKNFIIGNDLYDSQYNYLPGFLYHHFKRGFGTSFISCDKNEILELSVGKEHSELKELYQSHSFYTSLLACEGDKIRSIDGTPGVGPSTISNLLIEGLQKQRITPGITNPRILSEIFLENEIKERFIKSYYCTSIPDMYEEVTDAQKTSILNQIVDRFDNQGLLDLNKQMFYNYPLVLEALCI